MTHPIMHPMQDEKHSQQALHSKDNGYKAAELVLSLLGGLGAYKLIAMPPISNIELIMGASVALTFLAYWN